LDASNYNTDYGLKPPFAKPSVPDEDGSYFLTGVETPAYDKPSVPDGMFTELIIINSDTTFLDASNYNTVTG